MKKTPENTEENVLEGEETYELAPGGEMLTTNSPTWEHVGCPSGRSATRALDDGSPTSGVDC